MYYVGQQVVCMNDRFDPHIVEWGDNIPEAGVVYTVRSVLRTGHHKTGKAGPGLKLLELSNPKSSYDEEVCFSADRFLPLKHADRDKAVWNNKAELRDLAQCEGERRMSVFFGGENGSDVLTDENLDYILRVLIEFAGCVFSEMELGNGVCKGRIEEALRIDLTYRDPDGFIEWVQHLLEALKQDAIGLKNDEGIYFRITEDTILCKGDTLVIDEPSIVERSDKYFDPYKMGFRSHRDFLYRTDMEFGNDDLDLLREELDEYLESYDSFSYTPDYFDVDDTPEWIDAVMFLGYDIFLIWHPNREITSSGGNYIQG